MVTPKLSLLTLYNYTKYTDDNGKEHTLFDDFELPVKAGKWNPETFEMIEPDLTIDRDYFVPLLLAETAELPLAYPDLDVFKVLLKGWNESRIADWQRMYDALRDQYNPLHNFDRNEEYTDNRTTSDTGTDTLTNSGKDTTAQTGKSSTTSTNSGKDITETTNNNTHSTAAFDAGMTPSNKDDGGGSSTTTLGSSNTTTTTPDTLETFTAGTQAEQKKDLHGSDDLTHKGHLFGNIGVTTTQQMILEEIKMRTNTDMVAIIIDEFKARFCIMVY